MDRQRVYACGQFTGKCLIDHAVAFEAAPTLERRGHDIDPKVRLAPRPMPGMALVLLRFVHDAQAVWRECLGQLSRDNRLRSLLHAFRIFSQSRVC